MCRRQGTIKNNEVGARDAFDYGDVADFLYVALTVTFFVLAALLVGVIDRRLGR